MAEEGVLLKAVGFALVALPFVALFVVGVLRATRGGALRRAGGRSGGRRR